MEQSIENSRVIKASAAKIFQAFTDPDLLVKWQVPGEMTAKIHWFDFRVGGGYQMSLFYPGSDPDIKGKTNAEEDKYTARFVEIVPDKKIVEEIVFESAEADFTGEMIMEINLEETATGTKVSFLFDNIPDGIDSEDNEAGTISSLEKLAGLVE